MPILSRIKTAWNAFINVQDPLNSDPGMPTGPPVYSVHSPSLPRRRYSNERTIVASVYNRMSIDVADITFSHVQLDDTGRYKDDLKTFLNSCLTLEANVDQAPRAFRQDIAQTLFDRGVAALVPVDTTVDPNTSEVVDIYTMRVGEIVAWYPRHVRVSVYNEAIGIRQEITLEKRFCAIVQNPLYSVMNEPNSTLQRLIRKLNLLDTVDEAAGSGKLDLIIQLPYAIKSEARRIQADQRREDIEFQLRGSQYGIAYTDGTEKVTQLNRPAENNLLTQIEYLTVMLYGQLGITEEVMNGTADEKTMINYHNRTIKPIVDAIMEAMQRTFVGPQGIMDNQRILYFNDPFKFVPVSVLAEIADKFTRNEILTGNEVRSLIGIRPSLDPKADELRNSNIRPSPGGTTPVADAPPSADVSVSDTGPPVA